jgi:sulfur relay (sulfurtransferase) complex TusBCD TusD component (DsrE family)
LRRVRTKFGIIIETNEPEKAWDGVRFANASLKFGHAVKIFLMSAGVKVASITHEKYNAKQQIDEFVEHHGTALACGPCIKARNSEGTEAYPISTLNDCIRMVEWADKVITF